MIQSSYADRASDEMDRLMPVIAWEEFFTYRFNWQQGEHVAAIGPTGSGKTTLAMAILPKRKYITVFATKPRDPTLDALRKSDRYVRIPSWKPLSPELYPKRLLWPDATRLDSVVGQWREFRNALAAIYTEGSWCVYIDELWFIIHHLKLEFQVRTYLQQARSNNISLFTTTQRPKFVPLEVYDQSTHLFFWRDNDDENLRRISGLAWVNASIVRHAVANLERHQLLYLNTRTGEMYRTIAPEHRKAS